MWGFKPDLKTGLLIILLVILSTIISFPCWLLQKAGFKTKRYARFLYNTRLDQTSLFDTVVHDHHGNE